MLIAKRPGLRGLVEEILETLYKVAWGLLVLMALPAFASGYVYGPDGAPFRFFFAPLFSPKAYIVWLPYLIWLWWRSGFVWAYLCVCTLLLLRQTCFALLVHTHNSPVFRYLQRQGVLSVSDCVLKAMIAAAAVCVTKCIVASIMGGIDRKICKVLIYCCLESCVTLFAALILALHFMTPDAVKAFIANPALHTAAPFGIMTGNILLDCWISDVFLKERKNANATVAATMNVSAYCVLTFLIAKV